jgi:hypothetical protein
MNAEELANTIYLGVVAISHERELAVEFIEGQLKAHRREALEEVVGNIENKVLALEPVNSRNRKTVIKCLKVVEALMESE